MSNNKLKVLVFVWFLTTSFMYGLNNPFPFGLLLTIKDVMLYSVLATLTEKNNEKP